MKTHGHEHMLRYAIKNKNNPEILDLVGVINEFWFAYTTTQLL